MGGQKKACFPCKFMIVGPDAWSAGNAAGKYAGQPLKASCASYAKGLAMPALCPYPPPTNASVATLILTPGGKTVRSA